MSETNDDTAVPIAEDGSPDAAIEALNALVEELTARNAELEAGAKMPEAGFSVNFNIVGPKGESHQVTLRGPTSSDWPKVWEDRKAFLLKCKEANWVLYTPPQPMPAPESKPVALAREAGGAEAADKVKEAMKVTVKDAPNDKEYKTLDVMMVELAAGKEAGRATLNLYAKTTDRYPSIKISNWTVDSVRGMLKHVMSTEDCFATTKSGLEIPIPNKYTLRARAFYVDGAEYEITDGPHKGTKGHYKNVEHLRLLE